MFFNPNTLYSPGASNFGAQTRPTFEPINYAPSFPMGSPQVFDFERTEVMLPEYFNNLFLYERVWTPINKQSTATSKAVSPSAMNYFQRPMAQSTPRAIRKTVVNEDAKQIYKEENAEMAQSKCVLRPKVQEIKQIKPKMFYKNETKSSLDSSTFSIDSFSPKSNSSRKKKLPLRSQGIDMSQFLNKNSDCASSFESSSFGTESDFRPQFKINIQNKCLFCENNGEPIEIYMSHPLKDSLGKVVCPVLRNYTCPKCGESGDYAHTNKYCPETQRKQKECKIRKFINLKD